MNRTTLGYIVMIAASVAVIWAIVQYGKRLKAPPDWSGKWWVLEPSANAQTARFDQSGIYLHLKVGDERPYAYRLETRGVNDFWLHHDGEPRQVQFTKYDNGDSLIIPGTDGPLKLWRDAKSRNAAERDGTTH